MWAWNKGTQQLHSPRLRTRNAKYGLRLNSSCSIFLGAWFLSESRQWRYVVACAISPPIHVRNERRSAPGGGGHKNSSKSTHKTHIQHGIRVRTLENGRSVFVPLSPGAVLLSVSYWCGSPFVAQIKVCLSAQLSFSRRKPSLCFSCMLIYGTAGTHLLCTA